MKYLLISQPPLFAVFLLVAACLLSGLLIVILLPCLRRRALAQPNHRSSHSIPTPQGGGLAVLASTIIVSAAALNLFGAQVNSEVAALGLAALFLTAVGLWDDLHPIGVMLRLILQAASILIVLPFLPDDLRICPAINLTAERALVAIALLWFINTVNFMDGLDWLSVAEIVPVTASLIIIGSIQSSLPWETTVVAATLCGALLGFAPFNKPVARLFLGDTGSLPVGLLLGWCLLHVAAEGYMAAALLLPLYYLADTSITLARRVVQKKPFWQAHREHFYQRATDNRFTPREIIRDVFLLNLFLSVLALVTVEHNTLPVNAAALAAGGCAVSLVLWRFADQSVE
ncbi:MAG: glycosyl transferase [Xanthobacteraceae bacterium]|nr:glycosyl transferase [Xanthobacteraceae bacterium]